MKKFAFYLLSLMISLSSLAQSDTLFWFGAPDVTAGHSTGGDPTYIQLHSYDLPATVTIDLPANPAFTPIVVDMAANSHSQVSMYEHYSMIENSVASVQGGTEVLPTGIRIRSTAHVSAQYVVATPNNGALFSLRGSEGLGTEFFIPLQNYYANSTIFNPDPRSGFIITATEDNTQVEITPTTDLVNHVAPSPFIIMLDKGESYTGLSNAFMGPDHAAGTKVTSDKPVVVSIFDDSVQKTTNKDLLGEQIYPVSKLGREYAVFKTNLSQTDGGEKLFVLSTANNNMLWINGSTVATLNEGQVFDSSFVDTVMHIQTDSLSYVYQLGGTNGEMDMALAQPLATCNGSYMIKGFRHTSTPMYLTLITSSVATAGFSLNGGAVDTDIPLTEFGSLPSDPTLHWATMQVDTLINFGEQYTISNNLAPFQAAVLHTSPMNASYFSYLSGVGSSQSALLEANMDIVNDTISICRGDTVRFSAHGSLDYFWNTSKWLSDSAVGNPMAWPDSSITYMMVGNSCPDNDTIFTTVKVNQLPYVEIMPGAGHVCEGQSIGLTATGGVVSYAWSGGLGTNASVSVAPTATSAYAVTGTDINGCSGIDSITIPYYTQPQVDYSINVLSDCPRKLQFVDLSTGVDSALWNINAIEYTDSIVEYEFSQAHSGPISVSLTSYAECSNTADTTIDYGFNIFGTLYTADSLMVSDSLNIFLYNVNKLATTNFNPLTATTRSTDSGYFHFCNLDSASYILKAQVTPAITLKTRMLSTYYNKKFKWLKADTLYNNSQTIDMYMLQVPRRFASNSGTGVFRGQVRYTAPPTKTSQATGEPVPGAEIVLEQEPDDNPVGFAISDENGEFEIDNVPESDSAYNVYINIDGYIMESTYSGMQVKINDTLFLDLDFEIDTAEMTINKKTAADDTTAVYQQTGTGYSLKLYPVPATEKLWVEFDIDEPGRVSLSLLNTSGVMAGQFCNKAFEAGTYRFGYTIGQLPPGTYFLRFTHGNRVYVKKLIKQ